EPGCPPRSGPRSGGGSRRHRSTRSRSSRPSWGRGPGPSGRRSTGRSPWFRRARPSPTRSPSPVAPTTVRGPLVLDDRVVVGQLTVEDRLIAAVALDEGADDDSLPSIAPGFVDVHVHGWGGHDAMGGRAALDGMARGLLRQGVTSLPPPADTDAAHTR